MVRETNNKMKAWRAKVRVGINWNLIKKNLIKKEEKMVFMQY